MEKLAIYPGSFDPVTNGHLDILDRALALFDRVIVVVAEQRTKDPLFSTTERCALLRDVLGDRKRAEVDCFSGLLVDYARRQKARFVVRGLRALADFEYEFQLALVNRKLEPEFDSVFLMTGEQNLYVSSSLVKEVATLGGDVTAFVPPVVADALRKQVAKKV